MLIDIIQKFNLLLTTQGNNIDNVYEILIDTIQVFDLSFTLTHVLG